MLADCYSTNAAGHIDVDAVAEYAGVTPATVHRWIGSNNAANSRHTAAPPARIAVPLAVLVVAGSAYSATRIDPQAFTPGAHGEAGEGGEGEEAGEADED